MLKIRPVRIHSTVLNHHPSPSCKKFCSTKSSHQLSKVIRTEIVAEGKFLRLIKVHYQDEKNQSRVWEALGRKTKGTTEVDAVEIVPILKRKNQIPQLVVLKQFRPPAGLYMIELPAGLVDKGEVPIETALRELKEETGYTGTVIHESVETLFGMAINNITCKIVTIEIDGDKLENQNPKQHLEGEEQAEVMHIPFNTIIHTANQYKKQGYGIGRLVTDHMTDVGTDGRILMLGLGLQLSNSTSKG